MKRKPDKIKLTPANVETLLSGGVVKRYVAGTRIEISTRVPRSFHFPQLKRISAKCKRHSNRGPT